MPPTPMEEVFCLGGQKWGGRWGERMTWAGSWAPERQHGSGLLLRSIASRSKLRALSCFPMPTRDFYDHLCKGLCCFILLTTFCSNPVTELNTATSCLHRPSQEEGRACYDCLFRLLSWKFILFFFSEPRETALVWERWVQSMKKLRRQS